MSLLPPFVIRLFGSIFLAAYALCGYAGIIDPQFIAPVYIPPGDDYFLTRPTGTSINAPTGFFGIRNGIPSDPTVIKLVGNPTLSTPGGFVTFAVDWEVEATDRHGNKVSPDSPHAVNTTKIKEVIPAFVDTIVRRKEGAWLDFLGDTALIPIEIVGLSLQGSVTVTFGGAAPMPVTVQIGLNGQQIEGWAKLTLLHQEWIDDPIMHSIGELDLGPIFGDPKLTSNCDTVPEFVASNQSNPGSCLGLPVSPQISVIIESGIVAVPGETILLGLTNPAIFGTIPEPTTLSLLGLGLAASGWMRRRQGP